MYSQYSASQLEFFTEMTSASFVAHHYQLFFHIVSQFVTNAIVRVRLPILACEFV